MKILHITPSYYPAYVYGGPILSTYQVGIHLTSNGHEIRVLTTDANGPNTVLDVVRDREVEIANGLHVRYCHRLMWESVSPTLFRLLSSYVRWADVVHLTGVYSFPTIPTLLACKVAGKPVVWSPRGALQRWDGSTHSGLKAIWDWICGVLAPESLVLHVTSQEEERESRERFPGVDTIIIQNGVEIPDKITHVYGDGVLRLLYLGRFHQKKGIESLLMACKILNDRFNLRFSLTVGGAGDPEYTLSLQAKIEEMNLSEWVKMIGGVFGQDKQGLFENTDIVVVPSYTENFGMVIAEALAHGVPVIASKRTPWQQVEEMGCGLWVGNDPESLAKAIERMSRMPLREMGALGRDWVRKDFDWSMVAEKMIQVYRNLAKCP